MARSLMHRCAVRASLLAFAVIGAVPAAAQTANLTLSRDHALWSDSVTVDVAATGCTGPARLGSIAGQTIDVDILGCSAASAATYSGTVTLGPLYPAEYTLRARDAAHLLSTLDTATLTVHPSASLSVDAPEVATDAAPVTLIFQVVSPTLCFSVNAPTVEGHVITETFAADCPILPVPAPGVYEIFLQVGPLPAGEYEIRYFDFSQGDGSTPAGLYRRTLVVHDADRCVPSDTTLCLQGDRFKVEVAWKDFAGHQGVGHTIPLADGDGSSGLLWFFQPDNVELTVKVLNGCGPADNGAWWVFVSSGTTVEYTLTVTDTVTGAHKSYPHAAGVQSPLVADTSAFSCNAPPGVADGVDQIVQ